MTLNAGVNILDPHNLGEKDQSYEPDEFTLIRARKKYEESVLYLLQTNPTLGVILKERLRPVADWRYDCKYYTNGIVIGYNPDAVLSMSILNNVFIIAHEVMHNLMCHSTRRNGRDKRLWNIAGDYCINSILVKMGIGAMPTSVDGIPEGLLDPRYDGAKMTTEMVYDLLHSKVKPKGKKKSLDESGNNAKPNPDTGDDPPPQRAEDLIAEQFKEELEKIKIGLVDDYKPEGDSNWKGTDSEDEPDEYSGTLASLSIGVSAEELEDMFIESNARAEFASSKTSGKGGFNLNEIIELNNTETVSWEDALKEYLTLKSKTKKNWMRPSNKWLHHGFWMPSKSGKRLDDIVIMIDESGSMSEEEVQAVFTNINELFEDGDIPLCNVAVIHFAGYSDIPDEHVELVGEGTMPEYKRLVSGGTNFTGAFNKAMELELKGDINPSCYIVMTDMEDDYPEEPDHPVLWMSTQPEECLSGWPGLPSYGKFTQIAV
jgi:predicted metal-dependent peptidase